MSLLWDQEETKVTKPFCVGTAAQKTLKLLLQIKILSYHFFVSNIWSIIQDCCFVFVCFCGRASPARHGPAGTATSDCLTGLISLRNFALIFMNCLLSSCIFNSVFRIRLFPQPFFYGLPRAGSLCKSGRSVNIPEIVEVKAS
jgi:hypothetical protein